MSRKHYMGIDNNGQRLVNVADPSAPTDAVNLQYLLAFIRGLRWKDPVRAASTGNINLAAPGASIDGVAMSVGQRFLAKNQTAGAENGIYVWNGAAVAATRDLDADSAAELLGASVLVAEGTANANKQFNQTVDAITLGTTTLTWVEFGGGGSAYTAGAGLALTGADFSVGQGAGIIVSADSIAVDFSVVVRKYSVAIGNGVLTVIPVVHNLGTRDVTCLLYNATTFEVVDTDTVITDVNTVTYTFPTAPTAGQFRAVVQA